MRLPPGSNASGIDPNHTNPRPARWAGVVFIQDSELVIIRPQSYPIPHLNGFFRLLSRGRRPTIMKLAQLLDTDRIVLDMQETERWPAIVELVNHLVHSGHLPESHYQDVLNALYAREEQVSTGIGSGIAIPHAFSDELEDVVAVFGRSIEGIDFEAVDNAPVHHILLFIVPRKDYQLHLRTLAIIAKFFTNCDVRRSLDRAKTRKEVMEILSSKPSRNTSRLTLPTPPSKP